MGDVIQMQFAQIHQETMNVNVNLDILEMVQNVLHVMKMDIHLMKQHVFFVLKTRQVYLQVHQFLIVNVIHSIIILIIKHQLVFFVPLDFYWMMIQILVKVNFFFSLVEQLFFLFYFIYCF